MSDTVLQPVLVTGAAGVVASYLCAARAARGAHVVAVDLPGIGWWRHDECGLATHRVACALAQPDAARALFAAAPFEYVCHLAARIDVTHTPELVPACLQSNVAATCALLQAAHGHTRRVVVAGTCAEYGESAVPLMPASWRGCSMDMAACTGIAGCSLLYASGGVAAQGFTTLILVILLVGGVQLVLRSVLGQCSAGIFDEVKARPRSIFSDACGFTKPPHRT